MTTTATFDPGAASGLTTAQRVLTLATVVLASSLYGTALLTTSTILPQMQGAMSATQDEIAWAMTFNILATAIVTPMTGWLVSRFGEKRVMVWSIAVFTLATMACGMSQSLETLVFWRIIQGGTGAPVVPLSQTILLNTFPRRQHQMVLGFFGMAVAVAPVFGPILGGYLAEAYSWRWAFYMLVPVGVAALIGQVIGSRGVGMTVGFLAAGLMTRIDPRINMAIGFALQTLAGLWMLTFDLNVTMETLVLNSAVQGFAVGTVWVPMTIVAFDTLAAKDRAEASSVFHLLRNIGSSFFISLSIAEIVRTTGANYSRMTEMITPYNQALAIPGVTGAWNFDSVPGLAKFANEIARQAAMIGYLNAFMMYTVTSALAVVFVLMVRRKPRTNG